jgi:hypothetical protein
MTPAPARLSALGDAMLWACVVLCALFLASVVALAIVNDGWRVRAWWRRIRGAL